MNQLINRAKKIILQPNAAWEEIKNEQVDVKQLLTTYVLPLALIGAVASIIGYGIIGYNVPLFGRVASLSWGISQAIISLLSIFLGILISAWVIFKLGPQHGASVKFEDTVKLVAYAYTPSLVAGIFYIFPSLSILVLLAGIYSLYQLYAGLQPVTGVSDEKKTTYFVISLIVMIAVFFLIRLVLGAIVTGIGVGAGAAIFN